MKLTFSPASPFARKVRIAAIELGLIDKIEFVPTTVVPGTPNDEYSNMYPLKKLPALILDNGEVIVDSYVIVEYLDELAGGGTGKKPPQFINAGDVVTLGIEGLGEQRQEIIAA